VRPSLRGFETPPPALIDLLCKHKATLKDIELMDMRLRTDEYMDDPSNNWDNRSWIPIFKTTRELVKPTRFRLEGFFTNCAVNPAEIWKIREIECCKNSKLHADCLKGSVEWYMVRGGDLRLLPGSQTPEEELRIRYEGKTTYEGDDSWYFPYTDLRVLERCIG
jgi:hypothetical protein